MTNNIASGHLRSHHFFRAKASRHFWHDGRKTQSSSTHGCGPPWMKTLAKRPTFGDHRSSPTTFFRCFQSASVTMAMARKRHDA